MKWTFARRIFAAAALACFLSLGACSESDPVSPNPTVKFKALIDKENVIYNVVQSYRYCSIEEYSRLLHEDYVWHNRNADVVMHGLDEYWDRAQDTVITGAMFSAKLKTHPDSTKWLDKLSLTIHEGAWAAVTELAGEPCENCWETTRAYMLELYMPYSDMNYISDGLVRFVVIEVQANERTEYRLLRADDLDN